MCFYHLIIHFDAPHSKRKSGRFVKDTVEKMKRTKENKRPTVVYLCIDTFSPIQYTPCMFCLYINVYIFELNFRLYFLSVSVSFAGYWFVGLFENWPIFDKWSIYKRILFVDQNMKRRKWENNSADVVVIVVVVIAVVYFPIYLIGPPKKLCGCCDVVYLI